MKNHQSNHFEFSRLNPHLAGIDFDLLFVYDGASDHSPMLDDPYCGNSLPLNLISSSNQLFLRFASDEYHWQRQGFKGFKLEYKSQGELLRPWTTGSECLARPKNFKMPFFSRF